MNRRQPMKCNLKFLILVSLIFSTLIFTLSEGKVGAMTCYREKNNFYGNACSPALDEGLGGTSNAVVSTAAGCAAFCDGSCYSSGCLGTACSWTYVNCTY